MTVQDYGSSYDTGLPAPGAVVGGYVVRRQVGQGGMAAVFEAQHQSLGKRVALKMLLPQHATRDNVAKRFVREGEAAARLNHPHAVDVTDVGTDSRGAPYLVMEFLEGEDLASLLDRKGKLSLAETADIMVPVISAIAAAHELGIVHRDLKPNNIFIAKRGHSLVPKVVDFGISKVDTESLKLTGTQAILGTPHYMSPEQAQGASDLDARSDQFSLGVILYECVVGKRPFESDSVWGVIGQIVHQVHTPASKLIPGVSSRFERIIERALSKSASERYPNVRKMGAELIEFAGTRTRLSHGADFGLSMDSMEISRPGRVSEPARGDDRLAHAQAATLEERVDERDVPFAESVEVAPRKSRGALWIASSLGITAALALGTVALRTKPTPVRAPPEQPVVVAPAAIVAPEPPKEPQIAVPPYTFELNVKPAVATIVLDGQTLGRGTASRTLEADGTEHALEVSAPGYKTALLRFKDQPPAKTLTLEKLTLAARRVAPEPLAEPVVGAKPEPAAPPTSASEPNVEAPKQNYGTNHAPILR